MQHQKLFQIIDEIKVAISPKVLSKLQDYVDDHFSLEESYMEKINYPNSEQHIKSHQYFSNKITNLLEKHIVLSPELGEELAEYLEKWLKDHVFGIDKDFESFMIKHYSAI